MKIPPTIVTYARTLPSDYKLDAVKVLPTIGVKLADYLDQNRSQLFFAGSLGQAAANAGFKLAKPLPLGASLNLHTFPVSSAAVGGPIFGSTSESATVPSSVIKSSIAKPAQVASLLDAFRGPVEELAKTHPGLESPLDILGFVVATPQVWNAMTRPGPKNKIEICLAGAQTGVLLAKVVADFVPGLQHAKPVLVWTGAILKTGEQVYAVINKTDAGGTASKYLLQKRL